MKKSLLIVLGFLCVQAQALKSSQWYLKNTGDFSVPITVDPLNTVFQKGKAGVDLGLLDFDWSKAPPIKNKILVAVLDYGVDPNHPELVGQIHPESFDFLEKTNVLTDEQGHGTHVTGLIAATGKGPQGLAGVAPSEVQILSLKVLNQEFKNFAYKNRLVSDYVAEAIRYAIQKKSQIINLSLGWPKLIDTENARRAVREALAAGILVVAAAGNDSKEQPTFPCSYVGVLCVGALSNRGELSMFSNWGGRVDLLAPGDFIVSSYPADVESESLRQPGYEALSGTSQSAPLVSGMAALLWSRFPELTSSQVLAKLLQSTQKSPVFKQKNAAQFGLPKVERLLDGNFSEPVFSVDFKALENILVDENPLRAAGSIQVRHLSGSTSNMRIEVRVQGQVVAAKDEELSSGPKDYQIPWVYDFKSENESSDLEMEIRVFEKEKLVKDFYSKVTTSRKSFENVKSDNFVLSPEISKPESWLGLNGLGRLTARFALVSSCGKTWGYPSYYRTLPQEGPQDPSLGVEILRLKPEPELVKLRVSGARRILQVIHCSLNSENQFQWVITSLGKNKAEKDEFQFFYLDRDLKPWSKQPIHRYTSRSDIFDGLVPRNYGVPGSFVLHSNGQLVPAFIERGPLPKGDNFDSFDPRSQESGLHLYFLEPFEDSSENPQVKNLRVRAFDHARWRTQKKISELTSARTEWNSSQRSWRHILFWGRSSKPSLPLQKTLVDQIGSYNISQTKLRILDLAGESSAVFREGDFLSSQARIFFEDFQKGSLAFENSETGELGQALGFGFDKIGDPLQGKSLGVFESRSGEKSLFLQSQANLVGFMWDAFGKPVRSEISLDRDSSLGMRSFNLLFSPVVVGSKSDFEPGVFVDSSQILGSRVHVITWDREQGKLVRKIRYALSVPDYCTALAPFRIDENGGGFRLPVFCGLRTPGGSLQLGIRFLEP